MNPRLGPALMTVGSTSLLPAGVLFFVTWSDPFVQRLIAVVFILAWLALAAGYVLREVANHPSPPQP